MATHTSPQPFLKTKSPECDSFEREDRHNANLTLKNQEVNKKTKPDSGIYEPTEPPLTPDGEDTETEGGSGFDSGQPGSTTSLSSPVKIDSPEHISPGHDKLPQVHLGSDTQNSTEPPHVQILVPVKTEEEGGSGSDLSEPRSRTNSSVSRDGGVSSPSLSPHSPHQSSEYSTEVEDEGNGERDGSTSGKYKLSVEEKSKGKKKKSAGSSCQVDDQEKEDTDFTYLAHEQSFKWQINRQLNRHKLDCSNKLTAKREELGNPRLQSLKVEVKLEPNDAERTAKLDTTVTIGAKDQEYNHEATVTTVLYDTTAMKILSEDTQTCKFEDGVRSVTLSVKLSPQESSKDLELRIRVKIRGYMPQDIDKYSCSEGANGFLYVMEKKR